MNKKGGGVSFMTFFKGEIIEPVGLHARPAAIAVTEASKYQSDITVFYSSGKANMKSIIQLMKLSVPFGAEIRVECTGEDEKVAAQAIEAVFRDKKIIK